MASSSPRRSAGASGKLRGEPPQNVGGRLGDARLDAQLAQQLGGRLAAPRCAAPRGGGCPSTQPLDERLAEHRVELGARATSVSPAASAASRLSIVAAAMPFMKTDRRSLRRAASPGVAETTSTGIPSGPRAPRTPRRPSRRRAPACASPRAGTGPSSATSAKRTPSSSSASSRFSAGADVFRSAYTAPGRSRSRTDAATARATAAVLHAQHDARSPPTVVAARRRPAVTTGS